MLVRSTLSWIIKYIFGPLALTRPYTALAQPEQFNILPPLDCAALGLTTCPDRLPAFMAIILSVINVLLIFAGGIALLFVILAGLRYITSRGDEDEARKAKMMLYYAVIGLVVIGFAGVIVNFVILLFR